MYAPRYVVGETCPWNYLALPLVGSNIMQCESHDDRGGGGGGGGSDGGGSDG